MSLINLTHHNESIYALKKRDLPEIPKPPSYQSQFASYARALARDKKGKHLTFGYAEVPLAKPSEFLKKKTAEQHKHDSQKCPSCNRVGPRKPPVPTRETPAARKRPEDTETNFVHKNVLDAVKLVPKVPKKLTVNTRHGDKYEEETYGLAPTFRRRPGFGKLPDYILEELQGGGGGGGDKCVGNKLTQNKTKSSDKQVNNRGDYCDSRQINNGPKYVCAAERQELLLGLKHNWAETMKRYQLLPIITDTLSKVQNKLSLEAQMKQLEKDIAQLERHPLLYVVDTSDDYHSS